jgi:phospholipase C
MLENHSFDNMLALSGIPGIIAATTQNCNRYKDATYCVQGNAPGSMPTDPGHEFTDVVEQLAGEKQTYPRHGPYPHINNSGFAANYATTTTEGSTPPTADIGDIMKCFDTASQLPVLHQLASQFVLCDQWFSSLPGPTWPNRFFLHGASSNGLDHSPSNAEMFDWEFLWRGFHYHNGSIFDAMNKHGVSWRIYHDTNGPIEGCISQVSAIHNIDLFKVHDLSTFESHINSPSYPCQYTFIEPNYGDVVSGTYENGSSQHPMDGVANGEALIAKVYECIRNSPIWEKSLLILTYDEHGGFYDHFPPGPATPPADGGESSEYNHFGFNFDQYGVRVPAVIVSPLLPPKVDHTLYDHTSVLATLEWLFGLPPLTQRDKIANVIDGVKTASTPRTDCPQRLNFTQPPAAKPSQLTTEQRAAREAEPVPDKSSLAGFVGVALKADRALAPSPEERHAAETRFQAVKTRGDARKYLNEVMNKVQTEKARKKTNP